MNLSGIKQFSTYFLFDVVNKALPFLLLPIITAYLRTEEFGILSNFLAVLQIFTIIVTYSAYTKLSTSYYEAETKIPELFSNLVYLILFMFVVCFVFDIFLNRVIFRYFKIGFIWQFIALVIALSSAIISLYTTYLVMKKKPYQFGIIQNSQSGGLFILTILFVVLFSWGWQGRILAQFFIYVLIAFYIIVVLRKKKMLISSYNKEEVRKFIIWGLPLLPHTLSYWIKGGLDKMIVTTYQGLSVNGVYSLALTIGSVMSLITTSFYNVYSPYLYKKLFEFENTDKLGKIKILRRIWKGNIIFVVGYFLLSFIAYFILYYVIHLFFKGDYLTAITYLPYVLFTNFLYSIYTINSGFLFYKNRTRIIGSITISCSIMQAILNIVLIRFLGIYGVLWSGIITAGLIAFFITLFSIKIYKLK